MPESIPNRRPRVIDFHPQFTNDILAGEKTSTYRFGKEYAEFDPDERIKLTNAATGEVIRGDAIVTEVAKTTFGRIPLEQDGHGAYGSREEMREQFDGFYKESLGRSIEDSDIFTVVVWEYNK